MAGRSSYLLDVYSLMTQQLSVPKALIVLDQANCTPLLKRLFDITNVRIFADGACDMMYKWNRDLVPTSIVGDLDSAGADTLEYYKGRGVAIKHLKSQDSTDFDKSLDDVYERLGKDACVFVYGSLGGRFDHILASINSLVKAHSRFTNLLYFTEDSLVSILPAGNNKIQCNSTMEGIKCAVAPIMGPTHVKTSGLKWNTDQELKFSGVVSTSNQRLEDTLQIECSQPTIWFSQLATATT